jgi:hypothetical protein
LMTPGVEAVTMFRNVQLRVKQTIGQDPWLSFPSLPAIYFAGSKPPKIVELTFWNSVKNSTNPAVMNTYLQRYPNGEFARTARALIERYEQQRQAEAGRQDERSRQEEMKKASTLERRRVQEIRDFAEVRRVEEQQRAEIAARAEELRKALDDVRMAREAATVAEQQRLAAVKAAEEAKERVKTTGLASPIPEHIAREPEALTRKLKSELARVGCNPGAVDGTWGKQAKEALAKFSQLTKYSLSVDEPTQEALRAVASSKSRICGVRPDQAQTKTNEQVRRATSKEANSTKPPKRCIFTGSGYENGLVRPCTGDPRERDFD